MERRTRVLRRVLVLGLLGLPPLPGSAEEGPPSSPLTLLDAARSAAHSAPAVFEAREMELAVEGRLRALRGELEPRFRLTPSWTTARGPSTATWTARTPAPGVFLLGEHADVLSLRSELELALGGGWTLRPVVALESQRREVDYRFARSAFVGARRDDPLRTSQAYAGLGVEVPLGRRPDAGQAESSRLELAVLAARHAQRHAMAEAAHEATSAYWSLVAAQRAVDVEVRSAARLEQIAELDRLLSAAQETSSSGWLRGRAQAAEARIRAREARRVRAGADLQRVVGQHVSVAPLATDLLPVPGGLEGSPEQNVLVLGTLGAGGGSDTPSEWLDSPEVERFVQAALRRRSDLQRAKLERTAQERTARRSFLDIRQTWDLELEGGYRAADRDLNVLDGALQSLFGPPRGATLAFRLSWQLPVGQRRARGGARVERARLTQRQVAADALERSIGSSLRRLLGEVAAAEERYRLEAEARGHLGEAYQLSLERLRSGDLDLAAVLRIEDRLRVTAHSAVDAGADWARGIAALRFENGTLVTFRERDGQLVLDEVRPVGRVFSLPEPPAP